MELSTLTFTQAHRIKHMPAFLLWASGSVGHLLPLPGSLSAFSTRQWTAAGNNCFSECFCFFWWCSTDPLNTPLMNGCYFQKPQASHLPETIAISAETVSKCQMKKRKSANNSKCTYARIASESSNAAQNILESNYAVHPVPPAPFNIIFEVKL